MADTSETPLLTGGCQCGAIRYAVYEPPVNVHLCHCRMCQKAVGGPFAAFAPTPRTGFKWTRGTPGSYASSTIAERDFCPKCGTPLTFRYLDGTTIGVTIGSLDNPEAVTPATHYGIESCVGWLTKLSGLPERTTESFMSAERKAKLCKHQHPDRET
jgi:hypothetical protein